jgi:hypothetical protein
MAEGENFLRYLPAAAATALMAASVVSYVVRTALTHMT